MQYENLYEELTGIEKSLNAAVRDIQKYTKTITKDTETGDLKDLDKTLEALRNTLIRTEEIRKEAENTVMGFDRKKYIQEGYFSKQILQECADRKIDAKELGSMIYEMFPNKVTVNADTLETAIDKKKYSYLRPKAIVDTIQAGQEKLKKESFNAANFLKELADAYDVVILKANKSGKNSEVRLSDVYKRMVPMARSKKEYDMQAFAFDLARLYASDVRQLKDGRSLSLGTSRDPKNAVRFLDENGREQYYSMISFI